MTNDINREYDAYYRRNQGSHIYPTEFIMRSFLGTYPDLKPEPEGFAGLRVLDLGFGDGRNMPLLHNLGFEVCGMEITEEICHRGVERMARLGIDIVARCGRNNAIPYEDASFDHMIASHACYYVDPGSSFKDNLAEMARVLKPGGRLVASVPMRSSYIIKDGEDLGDSHRRVHNDPLDIRNGYILKYFVDPAQIQAELGDTFTDFRIGHCQNNWWGIDEYAWTIVCRKKA